MWPFRKRTKPDLDWDLKLVRDRFVAIAEQHRPCPTRLYEPGVTHEHACIASSEHGRLDHTCQCGKTWPRWSSDALDGQTATGGA